MGYKAEKEQRELIRKRAICIIALIVFVILLTLCIISAFAPTATWKYYFRLPNVSKREGTDLRIHYVDVGQGDCTVIELPDGKVMLIDGGDGSGETDRAVMRYLNALDIDVIDYLVVTHADSDHCGALDTVLKYKEVQKAFLPPTAASVNAEYARFYKQLNKEGCAIEYTSRAVNLSVAESATPYTLQCLYPYANDISGELSDKEDNNALSSVFWLDYYGTSALFCGDAPKSVETLLLRDAQLGVLNKQGVALSSTEILKVAHHGSSSSTGEDFLSYLHAKTAVISCGEDNPYNHPSPNCLHALSTLGIQTYRTDAQGSIIATLRADGTYEMQILD